VSDKDLIEQADPMDMRRKIYALEEAIGEVEQIDLKITHHFAPGVYAREMFIPAGVMLTGKIHKFKHLNIISQGEIRVLTEEGAKTIKAPCTLVSEAGTKRAGLAITDTIWTTIHPTDETDLIKIEEQVIAKTHEDVPNIGHNKDITIEGDL